MPLFYYTILNSPIGKLVACGTSEALNILEFVENNDIENNEIEIRINSLIKSDKTLIYQNIDLFKELQDQLNSYFNKSLKHFSIPLNMQGTDFQKKVWEQLLTIPYGKTITYLKQAIDLGNKKAVRASASANGKNKISIIVPCHRVIGSDGSLTGYAGGLWRKKKLLEHESLLLF